jgi:hypothetical protein
LWCTVWITVALPYWCCGPKFYQRTFLSPGSSKNHAVDFIGENF